MNGTPESHDEQPPRRSIIRASILALTIRRIARKEELSGQADRVLSGPREEALNEFARRLAESGREDDVAVGELRHAASGHKRSLERVLAFYTVPPPGLLDSLEDDRTRRLLEAASTNRPIRPVSSEQVAWVPQLDALKDGGPRAAYERLAARVPGLRDLERDVRTRASARERDSRWERADDEWWDLTSIRLETLLASMEDPVLRSGVAHGIAHNYLGALLGLFDLDDERR